MGREGSWWWPYPLFSILPGMGVKKKIIDLILDFLRYFYIVSQIALFYVKRLCFISRCISQKNGIATQFETCIFLLQ